MPLGELTQQTLKEGDRVRLLSIKVDVGSDEQIEKYRAKAGEDAALRARIVFEMEPLSYRREDGANETGFIVLTKKSKGLTPDDITSIRERGILGVPTGAMLSLSRGLAARKEESCRTPYERFSWWLANSGITLYIAGIDAEAEGKAPMGQLWTPAIGQVLVVKFGFDDFPFNDAGDTYGKFVWYFTGLDPQYVAPPMNERDVRTVKARDNEASSGPAATTVALSSPTTEALREAAKTAGLIGMDAKMDEAVQQRVTMRAVSNGAPVFGHPEVMDAVDAGTLVDYLVEKNAVGVAKGKIVEVS